MVRCLHVVKVTYEYAIQVSTSYILRDNDGEVKVNRVSKKLRLFATYQGSMLTVLTVFDLNIRVVDTRF